jgi:hypothetical protein
MNRLRENRLRGSPIYQLERHVLIFSGGVRSIAAPVEKPYLPRDDFGPVAFAAAVFRLVLAGRQSSLDVNPAAFAEILSARLGQLSEGNDAVPFGALLFLAIAVGETQTAEHEPGGLLPDCRSRLPC